MQNFARLSLLAVLLFFCQSCVVSSKPKMEFFSNPRYNFENAKFTSVDVPMFLLKSVIKKKLREEGGNKDIIQLLKKISDVKVLTIESANPKMFRDYRNYLTHSQYEEWLTVKKDKDIINFQAKQTGDIIKNLLISIHSDKEIVLVDVSGRFTADDISRIISYTEKKQVKDFVKK